MLGGVGVGALAAGELGQDVDGDAGFLEYAAGAAGGVDGEAEVGIAFGDATQIQTQRLWYTDLVRRQHLQLVERMRQSKRLIGQARTQTVA